MWGHQQKGNGSWTPHDMYEKWAGEVAIDEGMTEKGFCLDKWILGSSEETLLLTTKTTGKAVRHVAPG